MKKIGERKELKDLLITCHRARFNRQPTLQTAARFRQAVLSPAVQKSLAPVRVPQDGSWSPLGVPVAALHFKGARSEAESGG